MIYFDDFIQLILIGLGSGVFIGFSIFLFSWIISFLSNLLCKSL